MLIADDEPKIRQGIAACFDWESMDITVAGLARNGVDLVAQCREKAPDLCLVDICMPQMDGLDAVDEIRSFLPETRFIIISGYEEFDYARRAVASGVEAFILKPIDEALLVQTVEKVGEIIRKSRENAGLLRFARKRLEEVKPLLFERFVQEWLQDGFSEVELAEELAFWQLDAPGPYSLLLMDHAAAGTLQGTAGAFRERLYALYHGIERQLEGRRVLWASLTPRVSLGVLSGLLPDAQEMFSQGAAKALGSQLDFTLRIACRETTAMGECFQSICEDLLRELEMHRQASPVIETVRGIIEDEYMDKELSLGSVAARVNTSASYLSRLFREETGTGFAEYLIRTRVRQAIRLMVVSDARIGEVADQVGYRSLHYFSNAFKKITGMSPGEYRTDHEGVPL